MITSYSLTQTYKITYRIHTIIAIKDFIQRSNIRQTQKKYKLYIVNLLLFDFLNLQIAI